MKYKIGIEVNLGNVSPKAGDFVKAINDGMSAFGFDDKLVIRSRLFESTLEVPRRLTEEEKDKVRQIMLAAFNKNQPMWEAQVVMFEAVSGF